MKLSRLLRRDPAAPSLAQRVASVTTGLARLKARRPPQEADAGRRAVMGGALAAAVPLPALAAPVIQPSGERAEYRARLLAAYAEDRASRPVTSRGDERSIEYAAASLVQVECWSLAKEIVALPAPATLDGLATLALASTMLCEVCVDTKLNPDCDAEALSAIAVTRALLAFTGTPLPPGFVGFGDEPDVKERDDALHDGLGSVPEWALAEFETDDDA